MLSLALCSTKVLMVMPEIYIAAAANEPNHTVRAHIYQLTWHNPIHIAAEIEEALWITPTSASTLPLTPLTEHIILPLLI